MILTRRVEYRRIVYCKNPHPNFGKNYHPLLSNAHAFLLKSAKKDAISSVASHLTRNTEEQQFRCNGMYRTEGFFANCGSYNLLESKMFQERLIWDRRVVSRHRASSLFQNVQNAAELRARKGWHGHPSLGEFAQDMGDIQDKRCWEVHASQQRND
jgi:hypothetical protein